MRLHDVVSIFLVNDVLNVINYYNGTQPHAVTDTKEVATSAAVKDYTYDANGNMTGWTSQTSGQNRTIVWNEENRVKSIADSGNTTDFLYDDTGERAVKRGQHGESVYINRFYAVKNGDLGSKHIFAGETRVVTKLEKDGGSIQSGVPGSVALVRSQGIQNAILQGSGTKKGINRRLPSTDGGTTTTTINPPLEKFQFFYHGDHLGSSSFITDDAGAVYEHLEYFPYGESWVEEGGSGQMPYYRFTGKELDPETGLYYYGARYYDPVLSRWISADPGFEKYIPDMMDQLRGGKNWRPETHLPGPGGVYYVSNLNIYTYAGNSPLTFKDPDGEVRIKVGGKIYEIHKYDADKVHPPEKVHLHDVETGQKVGGETGDIFDKKGKQKIGNIGKKNLGRMQKLLRGMGYLTTILTAVKIVDVATEQDPEKQFENFLEAISVLPPDEQKKIIEEAIKNNPDKFIEIDPKTGQPVQKQSDVRTPGGSQSKTGGDRQGQADNAKQANKAKQPEERQK